jgi:hypothetical protein
MWWDDENGARGRCCKFHGRGPWRPSQLCNLHVPRYGIPCRVMLAEIEAWPDWPDSISMLRGLCGESHLLFPTDCGLLPNQSLQLTNNTSFAHVIRS